MQIEVDHQFNTLSECKQAFSSSKTLVLSKEARKLIIDSRKFVEEKIKNSNKPIYGINTGFGDLCKEKIEDSELDTLQLNLVRSHACGIGAPIPERLSRLMMFLKIKSLTTGISAVSENLVDHLLAFYNSGASPVVFEKGSLGASGDLVPLAHMTLPLLGEGEVWWEGKRISGGDFLKKAGLKPLKLKAKEGLAMLNGTQFMLALGLDAFWRFQQLLENSIHVCSLAADVFDSRFDFLHPAIHSARPHAGQLKVAGAMADLIQDSELAHQNKNQVQDPYSVRCLPQVLGASWDAHQYVARVLEIEMNSVTDNPLVFKEEDIVVSGGNFHGQPLALALDFLGIAMAEVANISERLMYKIISGERYLPVYLIENAGLNSGFMIPQYSAASLVSQNKQLATPASVDSIVSSNGQEDHVSMGANAALKSLQIVENCEAVCAILLLAACQALEFRRPLKTGTKLESLFQLFRQKVSFRRSDSYFKEDIDKSIEFIQKNRFSELA
jgi:histidine ammonia-lyase